MTELTSKFCADSLRRYFLSKSIKLKPTHAHELVAAFFGYKSHAALLMDKLYPISELEAAQILVPDLNLMDERRQDLKGLPPELPETRDIAGVIISALETERYFLGEIWLYSSFTDYISEVYLVDNDPDISDCLSGEMADTNAEFSDFPSYEEPEIRSSKDSVLIQVNGEYVGTPMEDKPFSSDTIDFNVSVLLVRAAGKVAFLEPELSVSGCTRDWDDEHYDFE